jgi:radical SAM superfamily enzyme YgiQ (UPF0313 family)
MKNYKVLLIYPPFHRLFGERKKWMPLGILYLASYLNDNGIDAVAYNADCTLHSNEKVLTYSERFFNADKYIKNLNDNEVWEEIANVITREKPKLIGITALTEALGSVQKIIEIAREINPDTKIVIGGPHAMIDHEYLINVLGSDFVISGEGERTLLKLVNDLVENNTSSTFNIFYKDIEEERGRELGKNFRLDINSLPVPDIKSHYAFLGKYQDVPVKLSVSTSRGGCVHSCSFCYCSKFKEKIRWRSAKNIFNEIEYYVNTYGTQKIFFVDDTFTCNRQLTEELCLLLIDSNIGVNWTCTTHAKNLDNDLLRVMKKSGCSSIHLGVETGSERLLKFLNKKLTLEDIFRTSELIRNNNIELRLFFMVGFPTETSKDIDKSIDLLKALKPDEAMLHVYVPIPKTVLYEFICEKYIDLDDFFSWEKFNRKMVPYMNYCGSNSIDFQDKIEYFYKCVEDINNQH